MSFAKIDYTFTLKPILGRKVTVFLRNDLVSVTDIFDKDGSRDWSIDLVHQAYALDVFSKEEAELWRKIVLRPDKKAPLTLKDTELEHSYKRVLTKHVYIELINYSVTANGVSLGKRPAVEIFLITPKLARPVSVLYGKVKGPIIKRKTSIHRASLEASSPQH